MTISRATTFAVISALGVLLTMAAGAPQADPGVQLRAAIEKEDVAGDLEGAMALYRQVIAANGKNRAVTAKALLRLGGCLEKLGQQEARKVYERLVAEYGDQAQEVASARTRLAALAKSAAPQKPTFRRISIPSKRSTYGTGKLSPDGQTLAYVEGGSLWTVPVHGKSDPNIAGAPTRLTESMHAWDTANICIEWSTDGKWIGFLVEVQQPDKRSSEELYLVAAAGGTPRRVQVRSELWAGQAHTLRYALSAGAEVLYFAAGKEMNDLRIYSVPTSGGPARPVTAPITRQPALSPDGSRIAYLKGENWKERLFLSKEVWIASIDGTAARLAYRLPDESPGAEVGGPIWSPDGKMLAVLTRLPQRMYSRVLVLPAPDGGGPAAEPASFDLPSATEDLLAGWTRDNQIGILIPTQERAAIYTIPASGGRALQLTPKGGWMLAWTPDSRRIYFVGLHGGDRAGLEVVPAGGGAVERVSLGAGYNERWAINGNLSISPDGQLICFPGMEVRERNVSLGIFTLSIREGVPTRLTTHGDGVTGADAFSVWSPDGKRIAFIRIVGGDPKDQKSRSVNIFVIPREGGEPRQVTTDADRVGMNTPAWSPDGRTIAFAGSDKTLRIVPITGGTSRVLAEVAGSGLTWSPDGETLAYVSGGALWRITAAGGSPSKVETGLDARVDEIAWSPDGKSIAFGATSGSREHELWLMEDFMNLVKTPAKR